MNSISGIEGRATDLPSTVDLCLGSNKISAGFPSPADDHAAKRIDLTAELIKHSQATFFFRVSGESMRDAGIFDGDLIVVDRAIKPLHGHYVVAVVEGEFTVKQLWLKGGVLSLKAANPNYEDFVPKEGTSLEVWGVVTSAIKQFIA